MLFFYCKTNSQSFTLSQQMNKNKPTLKVDINLHRHKADRQWIKLDFVVEIRQAFCFVYL